MNILHQQHQLQQYQRFFLTNEAMNATNITKQIRPPPRVRRLDNVLRATVLIIDSILLHIIAIGCYFVTALTEKINYD